MIAHPLAAAVNSLLSFLGPDTLEYAACISLHSAPLTGNNSQWSVLDDGCLKNHRHIWFRSPKYVLRLW